MAAKKQPATAGSADQGWLPKALDAILNIGGTAQGGSSDGTDGSTYFDPLTLYDLFTGGPNAETFFRGASLDRVIFPPGPIRPSKTDQGMGALAALLGNRYNQRTFGGRGRRPQQAGGQAASGIPTTTRHRFGGFGELSEQDRGGSAQAGGDQNNYAATLFKGFLNGLFNGQGGQGGGANLGSIFGGNQAPAASTPGFNPYEPNPMGR